MRTRDSERGAALIVSLMMLMALGFVAGALIMSSSVDRRMAGAERRGSQAQFAAEAGIREAMHRMRLLPGTTITVNGIDFDPAIQDPGPAPDPNWEVRIYAPGRTTPSSSDPSMSYTPTVQDVSSGLEYARDNSFLSIRHKWRDLDGDSVRDPDEVVLYDAGVLPPENFATGSPIEVITVEGHRGEARRRVQVEAARFPFSPNVNAAVGSDRGVDVTGNVSLCGYNHRIDTPIGTLLPFCSPAWNEDSGHLPAVTTTGDPVDTGGSSDLLGFPSVTDTSSTNPFYSLAQTLGVTPQVLERVLANPDHTTPADGSPLNGLTYVNGDATGVNKFSSISGSGLLYVNGDMDVSGGLFWTGLIYVEGDLRITGNAWILGSVVVRGKSDYAFAGGTPGILYSREAIRRALESLFEYVVLSWKEL